MNDIIFTSLKNEHFPLLLKWLEEKHVKAWWDQEINYNLELVTQKYAKYVNSLELFAYIIELNNQPIGFIQLYDAHNFSRENNISLKDLPVSLAAIDFYIGDPNFIGKGLGSIILNKFLPSYVFAKFDYCFVDPEINNQSAIYSYERSGFKEIKRINDYVWMIAKKY